MFYNLPKTASDLPESLPIFPLSGNILLPRCKLPLNIFEPRYINMVFDSLCTPERIIGMVQPRPSTATGGDAEPYQIGCAGRITAFEETDDGRVILNLTGLSRFRINEEISAVRGYRRVKCDWLPFATDLIMIQDATISGQDVMNVLTPFFEAHHLRAEWQSLERIAGSDLIDVLSMNLPFPPEDKQALLEAPDVHARFAILRQIASLYAARNIDQATDTRH
ncbi:MAG: LON peptidase substrate-binding domain-containing protein [Rickettsiales bacterium]|nr:LON peptidase substrate-binding domain-containing protein [Rickettsiales bacterium]